MLEYGTVWFKQNLDARLVRIDYNGGNRPPVVQLTADKMSGAVPLTVNFSSKGSNDPDGDKLSYELEAAGQKLTSTDGNFAVTFDKPGAVDVKLTVKDDKGSSATSQVQLTAGNDPPIITTEIVEGNKTFYFPNTPVRYAVTVIDKEDGSSKDGKIPSEAVTVTFNYLKGFDMTQVAQGHQMPTAELPGKALIEKSDCKSCHIMDQKSAGPSYKDVAAKYRAQTSAVDVLAAKIVKGGSGVWGTTEMAAHPQIAVEDAKKMVEYILSLGETKVEKKLPLSGTATPGNEGDGAYILAATYYDKGADNVSSLSATSSLALRSGMLGASQADELNVVRKITYQGNTSLENVRDGAFAGYKKLDLTGVKRATLLTFVLDPAQNPGGEIEIRLDKPDGKLLGKVTAPAKQGRSTLVTGLEGESGFHDLYVVFKNPQAGEKSMFYFGGIRLQNK
jgi:cytochrome c